MNDLPPLTSGEGERPVNQTKQKPYLDDYFHQGGRNKTFPPWWKIKGGKKPY